MKILTIAFALIFMMPSQVSAENIEEQYRQANQLIEKNCATCMEATREGMLRGIHEMEKVIQAGFDAVEAKTILADAYNQMMIVYAHNQEEEKVWAEKKKEFLAEALEVYPLDDKLLTQYARTVDSYPEKIKLYRKAFEINPKNTSAGSSLSAYLLEVGETKQAMEIAKKTIVNSEQGATHVFGQFLFYKFKNHGMDKEAEEISVLVDKIFKERLK